MATRVETRTVGGKSFQVVVLENGPATAEIWPELGGNCVRWHHAETGELLFAPPIEELIARPTRGGIPILFPFPNRIRAGHFQWAGRDYYLPKNDSTESNAIHGFVCRCSWQVRRVESAESFSSASLRCHGHDCVSDIHSHWPADWCLDIHWMLYPSRLIMSILVANTDDRPLPMGLGVHPYFHLTGGNDYISVPAAARWELHDGLPSGQIVAVSKENDLRAPRRVSSLTLDDVFTQVESVASEGLRCLGTLERSDQWTLTVRGSTPFREVVVYTPAHRQAVCIEPYTCPTDAVNLLNSNSDFGWHVIEPRQKWMAGLGFDVARSA